MQQPPPKRHLAVSESTQRHISPGFNRHQYCSENFKSRKSDIYIYIYIVVTTTCSCSLNRERVWYVGTDACLNTEDRW